jgi:hypothetical protein
MLIRGRISREKLILFLAACGLRKDDREPWVAAWERTSAPDSAPRLRRFFSHLIESHTELFAGREAETARILEFVRNRGTGYVFVEGPSGYGKTSLLAHLVSEHPEFHYHFISQGYKRSGSSFDPTHLDVMLRSLCEQLDPAHVPKGDLGDLQADFQQLLAASPRRPAIVVLDAIDEVDRHPNYLLGLLPRRLPPGCVVVLSARAQGDRCYLSEVGLSPALMDVHLRLPGLDGAAIVTLLGLAGGAAGTLARREEFVASLYAISDGDPFYVRFLVEDVAGGLLTPDNVASVPSGLAPYLDGQLSQLNRSAHRTQHRDVLGLVLEADGALSRSELIHMVPGLTWLNFNDVLRDIHRFLLVHDDQYTFCHDRFKQYFASRRA